MLKVVRKGTGAKAEKHLFTVVQCRGGMLGNVRMAIIEEVHKVRRVDPSEIYNPKESGTRLDS